MLEDLYQMLCKEWKMQTILGIMYPNT